MDLKQLEYFITIVNEGNISRAARELHISQPPLSNQMKLLEEELGTVLFERGSRSIELTMEGKIFYERANTIVNLADSTIREIRSLNKKEKGTLRLGLISSSGEYIMNILNSFNEEYPNVKYEIYEGNSYQLVELLRSRAIDLAIVRTPFNSEGFKCIYLNNDPILAVGDKKFFDNIDEDKINAKELIDKPLLIYRRWEGVIVNIFHNFGEYPNIKCINDDARTTLDWAKKGFGIGLMPKSIVNGSYKNLVSKRLIAGDEFNTSLVLIENKYETTLDKRVKDIFIEKCMELRTYENIGSR